ncbi:MAG: alpha-glucosidase/alpha-galactosidase [Chloroflexota bacterium]|nr:alpha-glucosidase/alpha-galactosidase [Chloroflexota bacterium]
MPKITMIGAGSVVFTRTLLNDILSFPELQDATISLMDINSRRLEAAEMMANRTSEELGAHAKVEASLDRREALEGSDYVINMIQVGGYEATLLDFDIPRKYGLKQTIADTHGVGGVFRALRTIPVLLEICHDMQEVCPDAWLLNYTNPMAMLIWAVYKGTSVKVVGLCHSVQITTWQLSNYIGVPLEEIAFLAGGINHQNWLLRFERDGGDLYPRLRKVMEDPQVYMKDKVRFELFRRLGYFPTESSEHNAEYVPYFIQHEELIEELDIPIDEYIRRSEVNLQIFERTWEMLRSGELFDIHALAKYAAPISPDYAAFISGEFASVSPEYAPLIIHSLETGQPRVIYGNVENTGLIPNLPQSCCVEVPCLVDKTGITPCYVGEIPPQCAALNRVCINVQEMAVRAALEGNREHVYHAVMLDPLASSILTLDDIWAMTDELIEAHGEAMPEGLR